MRGRSSNGSADPAEQPDAVSMATPAPYAAAQQMQAARMLGQQLSSDEDNGYHTAQYDPGSGYGVDAIQRLVQRMPGYGLQHKVQMLTFHLMRKYSPTLHHAIWMCRWLEGDISVESEDEDLQEELSEWIETIDVGYFAESGAMTGLDTYLNLMASGADEYGLAVGEMIPNDEATAINRLVVPNVRTLTASDNDNDGLYELYQSQTISIDDGTQRQLTRIDNSPFTQTITFRPSSEDVWPDPLAWAAVQSTEVVMRMYQSVLNGWHRHGDPTLLNKLEFDSDSDIKTVTLPGAAADGGDMEVPQALFVLADRLKEAANARRRGEVKDANVYVDGGSLTSETLGNVDSTLLKYFRDHASVFDGHIISAAPLPSFLFPHIDGGGDGLGSARSQSMASIAAAATERRNRKKRALARQTIDMHLVLSGRSDAVGRYSVATDSVDVMDDKLRAEAAKIQEAANKERIANLVQLYTEAGQRRFTGEVERQLEESGLYPSQREVS